MKYVIVAPDNQSPVGIAMFVGFMTGMGIENRPIIGCYKGQIERSWVMKYSDFEEYIVPARFCENQESILLVSECNKQYAVLRYRPDLKTYWIAAKGNPDHVAA